MPIVRGPLDLLADLSHITCEPIHDARKPNCFIRRIQVYASLLRAEYCLLSQVNLCQLRANLSSSRGPFPRNVQTSSPHALADFILEDPGTFPVIRALGADPFSPQATHTNLCPPRADLFSFLVTFPPYRADLILTLWDRFY